MRKNYAASMLVVVAAAMAMAMATPAFAAGGLPMRTLTKRVTRCQRQQRKHPGFRGRSGDRRDPVALLA